MPQGGVGKFKPFMFENVWAKELGSVEVDRKAWCELRGTEWISRLRGCVEALSN